MLHIYKQLTGVTAFSTTRHGGVSQGAYATFNANHYCGDRPEDVAQNRTLLCERLAVEQSSLIVPHQTHNTRTMVINRNFLLLPHDVQTAMLEGIDAVCTDQKGVCVCVSTADCIPVLIHDPKHNVVSAVHAGWRGTVKRIVEKNIEVLADTYGTVPSDCRAVIGPGISLTAFEVGDEVYETFRKEGFDMTTIAKRFPALHATSSDDGQRWHIDLPLCNKQQLMECGLSEANIHLSGICTYSQSDDFFSARRLGIKSGRILNGIVM